MYNKKMQNLGQNASAIRELFEYGKARKKEIGSDLVYDFSIGNPSVPCPSIVTDTLINLIKNTEATALHGYTSAAGDLNVRREIVSYLNKKYHTLLKENFTYLTLGAAASLTISLNALLNQDDEVIVFTPFFPEYKVFVEKANGKIVPVQTDNKTFMIDFDNLEKALNERTKAVIINSPNNPTGVVYPENVIKGLCKILKTKEDEYQHPIYLISDEPYRELIYDDIEYPFVTNYYDNSIVCYSFSKSLSLPGERIGYIIVNPNCENVNEVYQALCGAGRSLGFVCAGSLFQYMIPQVLGYTSDLKTYKENRDLLSNALTEYGYEVVNPNGAFYLFVKALCSDAKHFSEIAKKYELLLVPSDSFGCGGYVRISYCVSPKQIKDSLPAFKKLIDEFKDEVKYE